MFERIDESKTKFKKYDFRRSDEKSIGKDMRRRRAVDEVPEVETFECLELLLQCDCKGRPKIRPLTVDGRCREKRQMFWTTNEKRE